MLFRSNSWLEERANDLPDRMTHEQLDDFIREWSATIKSTYGKAKSDITVPQGVRRTTADSARALRNKLMPEAAGDFAAAERHIDSTKTLRKMLVDAKGKVRPEAPSVWRKALENDIIMQRLRAFDSATGNNVTERGLSLARKKLWTSGDAHEAMGVLRLTSTPSPVVSVRAPGFIGKGMLAGSRPAGAITSRMMMERYRQSKASKVSPHSEQQPDMPEETSAAPEELFPGMTNTAPK